MQPREINAFWSRTFPECPPIGFLFKHLYADRWLRVQTLDSENEHAESEEELAEITRRLNALIAEVFDLDSTLVLITTSYSESESSVRDVPLLKPLDPNPVFMQSVGVHELALEFDSPTYWHLFVSERENAPGGLDRLVRLAAQPSLTSGVINLILLGPESKRLLYVRSTSAEVVLDSTVARDALQEKFAELAD